MANPWRYVADREVSLQKSNCFFVASLAYVDNAGLVIKVSRLVGSQEYYASPLLSYLLPGGATGDYPKESYYGEAWRPSYFLFVAFVSAHSTDPSRLMPSAA